MQLNAASLMILCWLILELRNKGEWSSETGFKGTDEGQGKCHVTPGYKQHAEVLYVQKWLDWKIAREQLNKQTFTGSVFFTEY